jgi:hypothetical protein
MGMRTIPQKCYHKDQGSNDDTGIHQTWETTCTGRLLLPGLSPDTRDGAIMPRDFFNNLIWTPEGLPGNIKDKVVFALFACILVPAFLFYYAAFHIVALSDHGMCLQEWENTPVTRPFHPGDRPTKKAETGALIRGHF